MRISRVVAIGALALGLVGTTSAAYADDLPVDPPPVVAPPIPAPPVPTPPAPEPPPAPSVPPVSLPAPPPVVDPNAMPPLPPGGMSAAESAAAAQAWRDRYGASLALWGSTRPGAWVDIDLKTGIARDANGNIIDLTKYPSPYGNANGVPTWSQEAGMTVAAGIPSTATEADLETIIAEPVPFAPMYVDVVKAAPVDLLPSTPVTTRVSSQAPDSTGGAAVLLAGWAGTAIYAAWRRRYRALDLLAQLRGA